MFAAISPCLPHDANTPSPSAMMPASTDRRVIRLEDALSPISLMWLSICKDPYCGAVPLHNDQIALIAIGRCGCWNSHKNFSAIFNMHQILEDIPQERTTHDASRHLGGCRRRISCRLC